MIRTLHYQDFSSMMVLENAKAEKGLRISVVIPALNEAATIGGIVSYIQKQFVERHAFVDEIIVMDGESEDETTRIAADAGATVYSLDQIGPSVPQRGKGVALWKSQFVSSGDIVLFIDSDILDFDERFIYGLAGPLLQDDALYLVKAFYRRPLILGDGRFENQGGRVTEIMVRPILCALIPELASIFQPLAGEYALRRTIMEKMPFWSGYGVEIGLLFDTYFSHGLDRIAQVDMEQRCHRNRSVSELGKMSFGILQVIFSCLARQGVISLQSLNNTILSSCDQTFTQEECNETELPPGCTLEGGR